MKPLIPIEQAPSNQHAAIILATSSNPVVSLPKIPELLSQ